jgi:hypothetical protein
MATPLLDLLDEALNTSPVVTGPIMYETIGGAIMEETDTIDVRHRIERILHHSIPPSVQNETPFLWDRMVDELERLVNSEALDRVGQFTDRLRGLKEGE